ncbi:MAG: alpha/beta fold hydrolase [Gammaproteobacteria bacterium]|nr:alpha/beta fold hydrolase [Gammaproteobacteria bacterium]
MRVFVWIFAAVLAPTAFAEPSLEVYGALPTVQNVAVSPNGEYVAYRSVANGTDIVRVVSLREKKAVSGAEVADVKPRDVFFVNNEQVLFRVADNRRVERFRGHLEVSSVFALDIATGNVRQLLTPGDGVVYPGQTGLGRIVGIAPDGKSVFMPAYYGEPTIVMSQYVAPPFALLRVALEGLGKPTRTKAGTTATEDFFVDAEGEAIAMEEFDATRNVHSVLALQDGSWQEVFHEDTNLKARSFVGLTQDRSKLVVLDTSDATGRTAYFTMSLTTGEFDGPIYGRDDADVEAVLTDPQRVVHGVRYSGFTPSYHFFDAELEQRVKDIQGAFEGYAVHLVDWSPDWQHLVVLVEGSESSGDYFLFSKGQEPRYLTARRPDITAEDVHAIGRVSFTARDGMRIPSLITIPRDRIADMKNLPAVVMPHGGPASHDEIGFDYWAQALANEGYLVIMPQFRGSSGFGAAHKAAGYGEWGRKMQDDISDAVAFFASRGMIDPERVCIAGGSYGGYAALAGGAFTPDLYRCVVSINGIGDLDAFRNWVRSEQGRSSEALAYWELQIGKDTYTAADARAASPEFSVASFAAPVLLIHAKSDQVVPVSQSQSMYRALEKAGKNAKLVELDGDDHFLSFGETRTQALISAVEFIRSHLPAGDATGT